MKTFILTMLAITCVIGAKALPKKVYESDDVNEIMSLVYGDEKFSTIKKDTSIEVIAPKHTISDPSRIEVGLRSDKRVKSALILRSGIGKNFIVFFHNSTPQSIENTLEVALRSKGTLLAVIEDENGSLYYNSTYLEIPVLGCAVSGGN